MTERQGWKAGTIAGSVRLCTSLRSLVCLGDDLANLFAPSGCAACGGPLVGGGAIPTCATCLANVVASDLFLCGCCGVAMEMDLNLEDLRVAEMMAADFLCRTCRMVRPSYMKAVAFGTYAGELRVLLGLLKFAGLRRVASVLGDHLARTIEGILPEIAADALLVPVPLYRKRERTRGFNQAALLGECALRELRRRHPGLELALAPDVLRRNRATEAQWVLSAKGRRRNLRGAFLAYADLTDRDIILLDDIMTTGATAEECTRVLLGAGAARVWIVTVARSQRYSAVRQRFNLHDEVADWDLPMAVPR